MEKTYGNTVGYRADLVPSPATVLVAERCYSCVKRVSRLIVLTGYDDQSKHGAKVASQRGSFAAFYCFKEPKKVSKAVR